MDQFTKDMGIEEIPTSNLEDLEVFNKKLISALDHHAPEKTKRITKWAMPPWFTDEVKIWKYNWERKSAYGRNMGPHNHGTRWCKWEMNTIDYYWEQK